MKMIILHKIKFYTEINQFSLYLLYIPVHDLNTLYTMKCLLNAPISIRMLIVNIYNEVSCTQSLDHKLVLIYNYLPFSPKRTFIIINMYLLCNNVTNTMAAVQHRLSLLPLLCMLKGGHGTTALSTCPHPHFTVDCIRGGKDALFNFAFVCFGESLETC